MHICAYTEANRPANTAKGKVGFNLTTLALEVFDGAEWTKLATLDSAGVVEQPIRDIEKGLLAERPVTGADGRLYFVTDLPGGELFLWMP